MITWDNLGMTSGNPTINMPSKHPEYYELDMFSYGSHQLWSVTLHHRHLPLGRDHFRTQDEAYEFVVTVVNLLEMKFPNIKCSNFSFLPKE